MEALQGYLIPVLTFSMFFVGLVVVPFLFFLKAAKHIYIYIQIAVKLQSFFIS